MVTLQQIARQDPCWSVEELVDIANQLLPQFLPDQEADSRVQDTVNVRLVRHYTTQGLLDKPLKQGREARYIYRHLLQLLLLRRLLAEGYSSSSLGQLILSKPPSDLEKLLQGGAQLTMAAANPALAFLGQVQERSSFHEYPREKSKKLKSSSSPASSPPFPLDPMAALPPPMAAAPSPVPPSRWMRQSLLEGLELHVREDFVYPNSPHERAALLQLISDHLAHISSSQRSPP